MYIIRLLLTHNKTENTQLYDVFIKCGYSTRSISDLVT